MLLQKNKKFGISQAAIKARNGTKITLEEIGTLERPPDSDTPGTSSSCHPATRKSEFYEPNVLLPLECTYDNNNNSNQKKDTYDGNIAMVEFGGIIRFYFIFNPTIYDNLEEIFEKKLQLDPYEVDLLLFNAGGDKAYHKNMHRTNGTNNNESLFDVFNRVDGGPWHSRIKEWPYQDFQTTQRRQSGIRNTNIMQHSSQQEYWFGATNPWITDKPDAHVGLFSFFFFCS